MRPERARWLVLAPHPDDETLGAGAMIADAAARGRLAGIVYLTDGSGSHPHADERGRRALVALRRREAALALRRLTGRRGPPPIHLGWRDAAPLPPGSPAHAASARRLATICRALRADAVAVTARHEPHCDHEAACLLAHEAARLCCGLDVYEYLVWARTPPPGRRAAWHSRPLAAGLRRQALLAHRSQLTPLHGPGFRLDPGQMRMPGRDRLYLTRRG